MIGTQAIHVDHVGSIRALTRKLTLSSSQQLLRLLMGHQDRHSPCMCVASVQPFLAR